MADRSVVVRLRADIQQYQAAMKQASGAARDFGSEFNKTAKQGSEGARQLGTGMLIAGGVMAAGFGKALFTAANFEKQMSGVKAVSGATADEMGRLSDAAIAAGANTKLAGVTASDAARAEAELVKAGVSVSDVLGGALMGSLTLAAAGQIEFANAATIAAQAMNIFDLRGGDVTHVADVLAAAANKSAGDVSGLGDALRQGGLLAAQTGLSLEETVGTLAAFADNALIGSDAGTSLKTMLQRLTPTSKESAALMEQLGFSAFNMRGEFIGLEGLAGELQDSLGGMTQEQRNLAMATLFGSDAVRAANILYEEGADGMAEYVDAVDDQGAAARMAAIQNDNLKGDIEALGGAFESVMIQNGSKVTEGLRAMTQAATDAVTGFGAMPSAVQTVVGGVGALAGATSLAGGAFLTLAPRINEARNVLKGMDSTVANFAGRNLGKLAGGLAGIGAAVAVGSIAYEKATRSSREYDAQVKELASSLAPVIEGQSSLNEELENFLALQAAGLSTEQIAAMNALGVSLADIQSSIEAGGDALDPFRESVVALGVDMQGVDFGRLGQKGTLSEPLEDLASALGVSKDALEGLSNEVEDWDDESQGAARRALDFAVANGDLRQSAVDAALELFTLKDGTINYAGALDSLAPKVEGAGDAAAGATPKLGDMADELGLNAEEAEKAREEFEKLQNAYRAAVDPLFAMLDALQGNREAMAAEAEARADGAARIADAAEDLSDAEADLRDARATPDNASGIAAAEDRVASARERLTEAQQEAVISEEELAAMNRDVAQSALDVETASRDLTYAVREGTVSVDDARAMLDEWVGQGIITADQAASVADQFGFAAEKAEEFAGDYIATATLKLNLAEISAQWEAYIASPEGAWVGGLHAAGFATGGPVRYLASGGPGGPRGTDTVPAWLTPGEYVIQKSAVDRFGVGLMDTLNSGIMPSSWWGGGSSDYSRKITVSAPITVADRRVAKDTAYELERLALTAAAP